MKKLSKNGFILVETLIVTVFIVSLFILIYSNVVPFIGEYEGMGNYDDIDSVYAINLLKQDLLRFGDFDYIDEQLSINNYLDISDCSNNNIYKNGEYCGKLKSAIEVSDDDYIFITYYDMNEFKNIVNTNDFFDSGKLSNFRDYVNTLSEKENFYNAIGSPSLAGKYRLIMTRTVKNIDNSITKKYANLGIYKGKYKQYNINDVVVFNPGDGVDRTFYVLKNSGSTEATVTLILNQNISTTTVAFNSVGTPAIPNTALNLLKSGTNNWTNVPLLTAANTYSSGSYTISYNGYRSRLLEPNDIYTIFGNGIDENYFNSGNLFDVNFDEAKLGFLSDNLTTGKGYWMANTAVNSVEFAWTIQKGKISPEFINNTTNIGVRPVITVRKCSSSIESGCLR